jgi:hypothetical protein
LRQSGQPPRREIGRKSPTHKASQYSNGSGGGIYTAEGWARDVSEDVASELRHRCDRQGIDVPAHLEGFMERHENRDRAQLRLVLKGAICTKTSDRWRSFY